MINPSSHISWHQHAGKYRVLILAGLLLVTGSVVLLQWDISAMPRLAPFVDSWRPVDPGGRKRGVIAMSDTRVPYIPSDPDEPVAFYTIAAIHNYLYAQSVGLDFVYSVVPVETESEIPSEEGSDNVAEKRWSNRVPPGVSVDDNTKDNMQKACRHPTYGWRQATWCKMPVVWDLFDRDPFVENVAYVDSDAIFRFANRSVQEHFDYLSPHQSVGFANDQPYERTPCAGYFFVRKEGEKFMRDWWNVDWKDTKFDHNLEQYSLLWMLGYVENPERPANLHRVQYLEYETQFYITEERQLIHHINHSHGNEGRAKLLKEYWLWDVPLDDRDGLRTILDAMRIEHVDINQVTERMALLDVEESESSHDNPWLLP